MALAPLAIQADLAARGIDVSNPVLAQAMLNAASTAVREAAGSPISDKTSTVVIPGVQSQYLPLPGQPIRSVATVLLDGVAITDWKLTAGALWRPAGWMWCEPTAVTVTMTHGAEVPDDIVQLVCSLAAAGINTSREDVDPRVAEEAIDDHRTVFVTGADAVASVFDLPERTKLMLATRFGGGASVTAER